MEAFINVIKKDQFVCMKINNKLDRYNRLTYDHKIEIVYDNLIQNIFLEELIKIKSILISDLDMELKMKISRIKYLESTFFSTKMTIIYLTENNTECYVVTSHNKGWIKVQKIRDVGDDKNIIYEVNPMETFIGKNQLCDMTEFSGAKDKEVFDGNTILLESVKENNKNRYVYIGGDMVCSFLTDDKIYKYISNMGNNLSPYSIATGEENYYLLAPNFNFIKKDKIDYNTILDGIYVPASELKESFEELKLYKIHSNYN